MYNESYLAHHGVKGMKWGIRRYQNEDGSLNAKGIKRYSGKHGVARYIADTDKGVRRHRNVGTAIIGAGKLVNVVNTARGTKLAANIMNEAFAEDGLHIGKGNIAAATALNAAIGAGTLYVDHKIRRGISYAIINNSNDPDMVRKRNDAQRYLRSQGIDV